MTVNPAYELAAHQSGEEYANTIELLAEMSQDFAASLDIDETLRKALCRIVRYVDAEAGSLFLLENEGKEIVCCSCDGPVDISGLRLNANEGIVGRSINENLCQMIRDVTQDPDFGSGVDEKTGFTTRSILCAPMSVKDEPIGAIEVINKKGGNGLFEEKDRHVLQALAGSAALALLNARLAADLVDQERMRRELELAAEIQKGLLPDPRPAPFPVAGVNLPARTVSGDFFDFFDMPQGRIGFALADVSGKGMNAALLMAKTSSLYRSHGRTMEDPGQLMARVNDEVVETATHGMFVTMAGGVLDPQSGRVILVNAGHEPPLLVNAGGETTHFPAEDPPLGIVPGTEYVTTEIDLGGGALYLFTDGVTESLLDDGSMLGADGFKVLIAEFSGLPLTERLESLARRIGGNGTGLRDDLTILAVQGQHS